MREANYNLAILALVCRCYGKVREAKILMADACDQGFENLELPLTALMDLLKAAGLDAVGFKGKPEEIPPPLQAMADSDHAVLVELNRLPTMHYKTWGVLEKTAPDQVRILTCFNQGGAAKHPHPVADYMTGAIVAVHQRVPEEVRKGG
jgi:hypothetical protein